MLAGELAKVLHAQGVTPALIRRSECDISDLIHVNNLFITYRPSLVINCAAHTKVDLCEDEPERANAINGIGVANLGEQALEYGAKLVHFSTDFVFDGQSDRPYRPNDPPNPLSAYGRSKLSGEIALGQLPLPTWLNIRTAWLFGRHGHCFPKVVLDRARAGHGLKIVNDQIGCPTYAADLAQAVVRLLDHDASGIWHLTNSSPASWYEFAQHILTEFMISAEVEPISTAEWVAMRPHQAHRPAYSVLDTSAYTQLTGFQMRDWRDALRDYRTELEKG